MSVLKATRGAQYPLVAEFTWNFDDTMLNTSGVSDGFASVASHVFDVINLPVNAVLIGGDVTTETAVGTSATYAVSVGDSVSDVRYMSAVDKKTAARTALTLTGYVNTTGVPIRLTVAPTTSAATAGKLTLRVEYIIRNRVQEVQTH